MVISGTLFLEDLRRRTLADERLFLAETILIAGAAAILTQVNFDVWGTQLALEKSFGFVCIGVAIAWGVVCSIAMNYFGKYHQAYASSLLIDGGMLYLALEHEPAEAFRALRAGENRLRLNPSSHATKSFRQRMLVFVRTFSACASGAGFQPFPIASRRIAGAITVAIIGLGALFIWLVTKATQDAMMELPTPDALMHTVGQVLVWLVLSLATINQVRRNAPKRALVDALLGDVAEGHAVLTSR